MTMMHGHINALRAQEAAFKAMAAAVMKDKVGGLTGTLTPLDTRLERADTLHAIGEAFGAAAKDLQRQVDALLDRIAIAG